MQQSTLTDPCDPSKTTDDIIGEAINAMTEDCSLAAFEAALDGVDKIKFGATLATDCPIFDCIVKNMSSGGSLRTSFIAELLRPCEGNSRTNINFISQSFSAVGKDPNALAAASFTPSSSNLVVAINSDKCSNPNRFDAFETIQHELIHADIKRRLLEDYGYDPTQFTTYQDILNQLLLLEYGESAGQDEHDLMLKYYALPAAESLWQMNGGIGTIADYLPLVLRGFPSSVLQNAGYNLNQITQDVIQMQQFINDPTFQLNQELFSC